MLVQWFFSVWSVVNINLEVINPSDRSPNTSLIGGGGVLEVVKHTNWLKRHIYAKIASCQET
jgi:hypothetical protein